MIILEAAPLRRVIHPDMEYGAVERVVGSTTDALNSEGRHQAMLFALPGSQTDQPAEVNYVGSLEQDLVERYNQQGEAIVSNLVDEPGIVHTHVIGSLQGIKNALEVRRGLNERVPDDTTIYATIHGGAEYNVPAYAPLVKELGVQVLALSKYQARQIQSHGLPVHAIVPNGVNPDQYRPDPVYEKQDYTVVLGRITKDKGTFEAITASRAAGLKSVIAGPIEDQEYFEQEIVPHIKAGVATYIGEVNDRAKLVILNQARALMQLSKDEAFSLTSLEAMACGTPVVASPYGALPEVVQDGKTGFIRSNHDGWVDALKHADELPPEQVRSLTIAAYNWQKTANKLGTQITRIDDLTKSVMHAGKVSGMHIVEMHISKLLLQNERALQTFLDEDSSTVTRLTLYDPVKPSEWHKVVYVDVIDTLHGQSYIQVDMRMRQGGVYQIDRKSGSMVKIKNNKAHKVGFFAKNRLYDKLSFLRGK